MIYEKPHPILSPQMIYQIVGTGSSYSMQWIGREAQNMVFMFHGLKQPPGLRISDPSLVNK